MSENTHNKNKAKISSGKESKMKCFLISMVFSAVLILGCIGCGTGMTAAGGGEAGGFALSETIRGIDADLERRETELVAKYRRAVELGVEQEALDNIERDLRYTGYARQGVASGKELFGIDFDDPQEAGCIFGGIAALIYAIVTKRRLNRTVNALNDKAAESDPVIGKDLRRTVHG